MENTVLIRRAQAGERESREVLIEQNLGLVHHIVKRFLNRSRGSVSDRGDRPDQGDR